MSHKLTACFKGKLAFLTLAAALFVGCQFDSSGLYPLDGGGMDALPILDAAGDSASDGDAGNGCLNGDQRCYGPSIQLCTGGMWVTSTVCDWGCSSSESGYPYCGDPLWAETVNPDTDAGTGQWVAEAGLTVINTDDGSITTPSGSPLAVDYKKRTHFRPNDLPDVLILGFTSITIPQGARVEVRGSHALALVAGETITIAGELFAQGQPDGTAGPGGYPGGVGGGPGSMDGGGAPGEKNGSATIHSGGGGGGFIGAGGAGGTVSQLLDTVDGGPGGATVPIDPVDGLLLGGHGGGASAPNILGTDGWAPGGGGGGALMLAANLSVEIRPTGVVNVGGGAGGSSDAAGGGGGSGGMILIQTYACVVEGVLAANGGGGGGVEGDGAASNGSSGDQPTPAGDQGGPGGAGTTLDGVAGGANDWNGGGGGGGAGFIRMDTVVPPDIGNGTVSPGESTPGQAQNSFPTI